MKKIVFGIFALLLMAMACNKEQNAQQKADEAQARPDVIYASVQEAVTKTDYSYDDVNKKFSFSWVAGDNIKVQAVGINTNLGKFDGNKYTAASSAASSSFSGAFSGDWERGKYAFYPKGSPNDAWDSTYGMYGGTNDLFYLKAEVTALSPADALAAGTGTVGLKPSITENAETPMSHIPMVGYNDADEHYSFKAVTGVLAITINSIPADATSISISTTDYALCGDFVFDENFEIKQTYVKANKGTVKTINFTPTAETNRTLYFPVPTGTIPAGDLTITLMKSTTTLYKVVASIALPIERGKVTQIPALSVPSVAVKFTGTEKAIVYFSGDVKKVSWTTAQSSGYTTRINQTNYVTTSGTEISLGNSYANGVRYFGYSAYNDVDATRESDAEKVIETHDGIAYYDPSLVSGVVGTYTWNKTSTSNVSELSQLSAFGNTLSSPSFTFEASDNISKGNIMITAFSGKATRKVYGFYKDSSTDLVFYNSGQPMFIENGVRYYMSEYYNTDRARFRVGSGLTVYGTTTDLYCQGSDLIIWHTNRDNKDYDVTYFLANKVVE